LVGRPEGNAATYENLLSDLRLPGVYHPVHLLALPGEQMVEPNTLVDQGGLPVVSDQVLEGR